MPTYSKDSEAIIQLRLGWRPNDCAHLLPKAEATEERALEAVRCRAVLDEVSVKEKPLKALLLKVAIGRQRLREVPLTHQDKAHRVAQ